MQAALRVLAATLVVQLAAAQAVLNTNAPSSAPVPVFERDGPVVVQKWIDDLVARGEAEFNGSKTARYPSPGFWGSEVVYSIMVDRFNNGNRDNDKLNLPRVQVCSLSLPCCYRYRGSATQQFGPSSYLFADRQLAELEPVRPPQLPPRWRY
jgi:hypothetical protein